MRIGKGAYSQESRKARWHCSWWPLGEKQVITNYIFPIKTSLWFHLEWWWWQHPGSWKCVPEKYNFYMSSTIFNCLAWHWLWYSKVNWKVRVGGIQKFIVNIIQDQHSYLKSVVFFQTSYLISGTAKSLYISQSYPGLLKADYQ